MSLPDPITFVAGASGFVGRALVAELAARGAHVLAHLRPGSPRAARAGAAFAAAGADVERAELSALDLAELAPTHVFFVADGGAQHTELVRAALGACTVLERAPRFVYLSSLGAAPNSRLAYLRARATAEQAVVESSMPFTIARPGVIHGPGRGERRPGEALLAGALQVWTLAARLAGARQHARRYRPTNGAELAHGLVHAGFNYTTIDRTLQPEELRYDQANTDEHHVPTTRRDHRH
jgi:uncharacterized protein YbjT (DUF2867 family)